MNIKLPSKKVPGIPQCELPTTPGVADNGAAQVCIFLRVIDHLQIGDTVGRIVMSTREARELGARLITEADRADTLAAAPSKQKTPGR